MNTVVLNREDHSIGDLPPEVLIKIFRELRGNSLIRLTGVCRNFNETIGTSKELMDKIRVKASPSSESHSFAELDEILSVKSVRKYDHISFLNVQVDNEKCIEFLKKFNNWKSIKLQTCHFQTLKNKVEFLSLVSENLEEVEFENIIIDQQTAQAALFQRQQVHPIVEFPKLTKLKCGNLTADFNCTNLKALEISMANQKRIHHVLETNPGLEELSMTYEVLDVIFKKEIISELGIKLKLKKLFLLRHHGTDPMDTTSSRNFQTFLKSQIETLLEINTDWFSGRPKRRSICHDWDAGRNVRRLRREGPRRDLHLHIRGAVDPEPRFVGRRFVDEDFNPAEDICVKTLTTIFQDFKKIQKLIVSDKHGFLSDFSCPSVTVLHLTQNLSITELRLRFEKAPLSDVLFEKLVSACPNLKSLFVHEMDQSLLECCARKLKKVESIFALSFKVKCLPSDNIKFEKLQRVSFCECIVDNCPELNEKKLFEQKLAVLKMITADVE